MDFLHCGDKWFLVETSQAWSLVRVVCRVDFLKMYTDDKMHRADAFSSRLNVLQVRLKEFGLSKALVRK
jgi:hypothetical protein